MTPKRVEIQLDHWVIHVSDYKRANNFYEGVLGAEVQQHGDGRWAYRFGDQLINVHDEVTSDAPHAIRPLRRADSGSGHVCFDWATPIEGAVEHLSTCGIGVEMGPVDRSGARGTGKSVYFRDPDGNLLELISYSR
jgi:catechol 2,3-dioxygenase-like lactoylglutathione lyase family enzyme